MSPVSGSSQLLGAAYDVAVAKKVLTNTREQGQQALTLIEGAAAPEAPQGPLGNNVNIRA